MKKFKISLDFKETCRSVNFIDAENKDEALKKALELFENGDFGEIISMQTDADFDLKNRQGIEIEEIKNN